MYGRIHLFVLQLFRVFAIPFIFFLVNLIKFINGGREDFDEIEQRKLFFFFRKNRKQARLDLGLVSKISWPDYYCEELLDNLFCNLLELMFNPGPIFNIDFFVYQNSLGKQIDNLKDPEFALDVRCCL